MKCYWILILLLLSFSFAGAQENSQDSVKKIHWDYVKTLFIIRDSDPPLQKFIGDVIFRLDSSYLYCDSAIFNQRDNFLEAFSNIKLNQGDTLFVYGKYLQYDGNTKFARLRHNVRMVSIQQDSSVVTLYTDSLDYDRRIDVGYYFEGGRIVDVDNELTSVYGQYSPQTKIATFNDSVHLDNPNFILDSDTLEYSTESKIVTILGPSVIKSDSGIIHSSKGWYDTQENTSLLLDRSVVLSDTRILTGDSLMYKRELGIGEAFRDMSIVDTAQKVTLTGHYGYSEEKTEYAFASDSACAIEYSQGDSLFLHGEFLELTTVDSTSRYLRATNGVRFYRADIQGKCDSMRFNTKDSVLYMYGNPVLWSDDWQLTGDSIVIYMSDSAVDYVHVPSSSFVVQEVEPGYYNQLGGNDLKAYFRGKMIEHIFIDGSAELIYYTYDRDSLMIGLNYMMGPDLLLNFDEDGKMFKMKMGVLSKNIKGRMIPFHMFTEEDKHLRNFNWYGNYRPQNRYDIFRFSRWWKEPETVGEEEEPDEPDKILNKNITLGSQELNNRSFQQQE